MVELNILHVSCHIFSSPNHNGICRWAKCPFLYHSGKEIQKLHEDAGVMPSLGQDPVPSVCFGGELEGIEPESELSGSDTSAESRR